MGQAPRRGPREDGSYEASAGDGAAAILWIVFSPNNNSVTITLYRLLGVKKYQLSMKAEVGADLTGMVLAQRRYGRE